MQDKVRLFMEEVKGLTVTNRPHVPVESAQELCFKLIVEEYTELLLAMNDFRSSNSLQDMVQIADGMADLIYVILYAANTYGLDMVQIFDEVQRSNMTKKGGEKREDGKQLKPKNFSPPDIESIILRQLGIDIIAYKEGKPSAFITANGRIIQ